MDLVSLSAIVVGTLVIHHANDHSPRVTGVAGRGLGGEHEVGINVVVRDIETLLAASGHVIGYRDRSGKRRAERPS